MIGTPPSKRPMWHDPAEHARDFAERYAEPMNYHVENRMMELGIPTDRIVRGNTATRTALSGRRRRPAAATHPAGGSPSIRAYSTLS